MSLNISSGYTSQITDSSKLKSKLNGYNSGQNKYFKQWSSKFKNLKFYIGETAFGKEGTGNITISKEEMAKLEADPKRRAEFEKMLKQCNEVSRQMASSGDARLKKQGFFINKDGELHGWTIASDYYGADQKYNVTLSKEQPGRWKSAMSSYVTSVNPNYFDYESRFTKST